jgi:hypothetical protein
VTCWRIKSRFSSGGGSGTEGVASSIGVSMDLGSSTGGVTTGSSMLGSDEIGGVSTK